MNNACIMHHACSEAPSDNKIIPGQHIHYLLFPWNDTATKITDILKHKVCMGFIKKAQKFQH
jgi:hypothetical protein